MRSCHLPLETLVLRRRRGDQRRVDLGALRPLARSSSLHHEDGFSSILLKLDNGGRSFDFLFKTTGLARLTVYDTHSLPT
uniref:Uncharacterized protein n=1 Tax=Knipowitschia caucasica TaxID=637954 RepID=A0AAV2JMX4_KNICA